MTKATAFKTLSSLLIWGLLAVSNWAHAQVTSTYDFGTLSMKGTSPAYLSLAPNDFSSNPFANLLATDNENGTWQFTLRINNNLFSSFGNNAYIQSINFDFNPDPDPRPKSVLVGSNLEGVQATWSFVGNGLASTIADIDFGTGFGKNSGDRLQQSDWVTWDVIGLTNTSLVNMYLNIKGITGGYVAKYTPIAPSVPEPETYAMLLVGLALLGVTARRRKETNLQA